MSYTLSNKMLKNALCCDNTRIRNFINMPYPLDFQLDDSGPLGGGRVKRYRLGDILGRVRDLPWFKPHLEQRLIQADATYRYRKQKERV